MFNPAAARARCKAATAGEWIVKGPSPGIDVGFDDGGDYAVVTDGHVIAEAFHKVAVGVAVGAKDNAEFIAHARSDLPAALEALVEAQAEARKLRHWARDFPQKRVWVHIVIESCNAILGESE
jgi:hypothetical protein